MESKLVYAKAIKSDESKPWLVMVHGFTVNHKIFSRQETAFKERFNLLLVDLRGHGGSSHIKGPYGREEYTDDLERVIEESGIEKFYFWGTHTGSAVGLIYALRHPGQVAALILEGTPLPGFDMPRLAELVKRAEKTALEKGVEAAKREWFDHADWFEYIRANPVECKAEEHWRLISEFKGEPLVSSVGPRETTNVSKRLNELDLPVLLYNGEKDMKEFLNAAKYANSGIKGSKFVLVPKSGGFPCWENPEEVNKAAGSFLDKISGIL